MDWTEPVFSEEEEFGFIKIFYVQENRAEAIIYKWFNIRNIHASITLGDNPNGLKHLNHLKQIQMSRIKILRLIL